MEFTLNLRKMISLLLESIDPADFKIIDETTANAMVILIEQEHLLTLTDIRIHRMDRLIQGVIDNKSNRIRSEFYEKLKTRISAIIDEGNRDNTTVVAADSVVELNKLCDHITRMDVSSAAEITESAAAAAALEPFRESFKPSSADHACRPLKSYCLIELVSVLESCLNPVTFEIRTTELASCVLYELIARDFSFGEMKVCKIHSIVNSLRLVRSNIAKCPMVYDLHLKVCRIEAADRFERPPFQGGDSTSPPPPPHHPQTIESVAAELEACIDRRSMTILKNGRVMSLLWRLASLRPTLDEAKQYDLIHICRIISRNTKVMQNRDFANKILAVFRDMHASKHRNAQTGGGQHNKC